MKTVVTHSGKFHPDEVFAVACIMMVEGKENIKVVRTREESLIKTGDWVVDVGGEYDPERLRFDHHQPDSPKRENGMDYAAFGLVWKHYGEQLAGSKEVADKIEKKIVLPIDAGDVGVSVYETNEHNIEPIELFDVINSFLPPWESDQSEDEQFLKAVDFVIDYLQRTIAKGVAKLEMKKYALDLYENTQDKSVIVSEKRVSSAIYSEFDDVFAVVSPDKNRDGYWMVTTVPDTEKSFSHKKMFPEEWGGLRGAELEKVSGINGLDFCHKVPFILGAFSKEAALKATEFLG